MTDGNAGAFPETDTTVDFNLEVNENVARTFSRGGLTKREYFAAKALQALLTDPMTVTACTQAGHSLPYLAVGFADDLIEQLNAK